MRWRTVILGSIVLGALAGAAVSYVIDELNRYLRALDDLEQ